MKISDLQICNLQYPNTMQTKSARQKGRITAIFNKKHAQQKTLITEGCYIEVRSINDDGGAAS
jgi:hypothetical protein